MNEADGKSKNVSGEVKGKSSALNVGATDFKPKLHAPQVVSQPILPAPSWPVPAAVDAKSFPFNTAAKEYKPSAAVKEALPTFLVVKSLGTPSLNAQTVCKQLDKKKVLPPAGKETWPISTELTIKEAAKLEIVTPDISAQHYDPSQQMMMYPETYVPPFSYVEPPVYYPQYYPLVSPYMAPQMYEAPGYNNMQMGRSTYQPNK